MARKKGAQPKKPEPCSNVVYGEVLPSTGAARDDAGEQGGEVARTKKTPVTYRPEFADQARKICALGATDVEIADFFGIVQSTVWKWSQRFPEFAEAVKAGKDAADDRVERSLYARAVGYTYDTEKIFQHQGEVVRAPYREHMPPDTTAMIFWLKNRRPDDWRDRRVISGSADDPVELTVKFVGAATDDDGE